MKVIDFHSHFFSAPFFRALAEQSPLAGDVDTKLAALAAKTGIELPSDDVAVHLERWLAELDRYDVEHLVTFASLPQESAAVAEAVRLARGRLTAIALVNPALAEAVGKTRSLLTEHGFAGLLFFPAMHGFDVSSPAIRPVLEILAEQGAVLYVHCGILIVRLRDLLGLPKPYDLRFANPLSLIPAANAFPDIKFIIPHFGAGFFRETLIAGAQCENLYVDTSSSNSWIKTAPRELRLRDVFERTLGVFGADRVLFGTDSNVFPAGWRRDRLDEQCAALDDLGASSADKEKIFSANARQILCLG